MSSLGEIDITLTRGNISARLRALVMKNLQAPCFGGTTFHWDNDIQPQIRKRQIKIHDKHILFQSDEMLPLLSPSPSNTTTTSKPPNSTTPPKHMFLKLNRSITLPPDASIQIPLGNNPHPTSPLIAIHPLSTKASLAPQIANFEGSSITYTNHSSNLLGIDKSTKFLCMPASVEDLPNKYVNDEKHLATSSLTNPLPIIEKNTNLSVLTKAEIMTLSDIHKTNINAFNDDLSKGYNAKSGRYLATLTFKQETLPESKTCPIPLYNSKCSALQQAVMDNLENQNILVDPQKHNIQVRKISPSFILQKGRAKHKKLDDCCIDEIRWVVAFNNLNDCILPKPSKPTSSKNILSFLAKHKYHIYADLHNSYFQIPIARKDWQWMGVRTPFKGVRVLTRAGQGLLNSEHDLDELISRILGNELAKGICYAERDDIAVGGQTIQEAILNWKTVLTKLNENNMKISPNKVKIFPEDIEVFGWRIKNGKVMPSDHIITNLGKSSIDQLTTVKQVNSWKGLYKTLLNALPHLAAVMDPFDKATAKLESKAKFQWTPELIAAFNKAQSHLEQVNALTLPAPHEQLILMPDGARVPGGIGWALFVQREIDKKQRLLPVQFFSAKIKPYMQKWLPCEIEGVASAMAVNACSHWILASSKPTYVTPDCKAVVQAVERMRQGKLSRNPRLQMILICINRRPVTFLHSSAKTGQHIIPDTASRLDITCKSKDCAVERFLAELPDDTQCMSSTTSETISDFFSQDTNPCVIAATSADLLNLLSSPAGLPIGNRELWKSIQSQDKDLSKVFEIISTGDSPRKTASRTMNAVFKQAVIDDGLLVVKQTDPNLYQETKRIVVPKPFIPAILSMIHLKGNHPSKFQSEKIFQKYFFSPGLKEQLDELYEQCYLCNAVKKIPQIQTDLHTTRPPEQPGTHMNIDIVRRANQYILVNIDLFSKFMTTTLITSEKKEDLIEGIIRTVTPLRRSNSTLVRSDAAPALRSLAETPHPDLQSIGIQIIVGEDFNKNKNCHVDKAIQELENEIRKLDPSGSKISSATLAQATLRVNSLIRHHGYSSSDITFRRDENSNTALHIPDKLLSDKQHETRLKNQSALNYKNHAKTNKTSSPGDIIMLKTNSTKHKIREPFLVTNQNGHHLTIKKILNSSSDAPIKTSHRTQLIRQSQAFPLKKFFNPNPHPTQTKFQQPHEWDPHVHEEGSDNEDDREITKPSIYFNIPPELKDQRAMEDQDSLPHIFNTQPDLLQPDSPIEFDQEYRYQLQRQIWERQLILSRISQSSDDSDPYTEHRALETLAREEVRKSLPHPEHSSPKPLHCTEMPLPERRSKLTAKQKIDELYNIPQTDGAVSTDVSISATDGAASADVSLSSTNIIETSPDPPSKEPPASHLWQHISIYGYDEDDVFYSNYLSNSLPSINMEDTDMNMIDDTWTRRKRSVSESDLIDTRLYSFTERSILI